MYFVYLMANEPFGTLYIGVTSDLMKRVFEHKSKAVPSFTARYGVDRLVCVRSPPVGRSRHSARKAAEKWQREWKLNLIGRDNPDWVDLYPTLTP